MVDDTDPVGSDDYPIRIVSFSAFYEAEYRAMVRLAVALVGRRDVAEELVQDAFVTLHGRWEQVSKYESPEGWLRRVVINRSMSTLRRRAVEVRLLGRLSRLRERHAEVPEIEGEIWQTVAALPKRQAQVIALMFVDDLSVSEIAAVLECEENTVRTHLRRARQSLADAARHGRRGRIMTNLDDRLRDAAASLGPSEGPVPAFKGVRQRALRRRMLGAAAPASSWSRSHSPGSRRRGAKAR